MRILEIEITAFGGELSLKDDVRNTIQSKVVDFERSHCGIEDFLRYSCEVAKSNAVDKVCIIDLTKTTNFRREFENAEEIRLDDYR